MVQDIEAGQVLVSVPMRLAITDHFDAAALQVAGLEGTLHCPVSLPEILRNLGYNPVLHVMARSHTALSQEELMITA